MALIPQVADAVRVPVIAAGGIGDGRGIAAAMALGAAGVQMGTAFLSCPEAATDAPRRARLRNATDTDTMVTDAISGRAARTLRSRYAEEMERMREPRVDFPLLCADPARVEHGAEDDVNFHLYGQAAALNVELPARALMERLVAEAQRTFARLRVRNKAPPLLIGDCHRLAGLEGLHARIRHRRRDEAVPGGGAHGAARRDRIDPGLVLDAVGRREAGAPVGGEARGGDARASDFGVEGGAERIVPVSQMSSPFTS